MLTQSGQWPGRGSHRGSDRDGLLFGQPRVAQKVSTFSMPTPVFGLLRATRAPDRCGDMAHAG